MRDIFNMRWYFSFLFGFLLSFVSFVSIAYAGEIDVNTVSRNIETSFSLTPGLITGVAYISGLLAIVKGILTTKEHVEKGEGNQPIRVPITWFMSGGALFAMPIVTQAALNTITGGTVVVFDPRLFTFEDTFGGLLGGLGGAAGGVTSDFNAILANITQGVELIPGMVTAVCYMLGVLSVYTAIIKVREHIQNPNNTPMQEGIIRFLTAGALFSMPYLWDVMRTTVGGSDGVGVLGGIFGFLRGVGFYFSTYARNACDPTGGLIDVIGGGGATLGSAICGVITHTGALTLFLSLIAYFIGIVLAVWSVFKLREHIQDPSRTSVWQPITRFIAAGAFLSLPIIVEAIRTTLTPIPTSAAAILPVGTYNDAGLTCSGENAAQGLDGALHCFMHDTLGPIHSILNFFSIIAGTIFIMIGISRLLKGAQDGAKAPGGFGTLMTFAIGGTLISYNEMMRAFSSSFFGSPMTFVHGELAYADGMSPEETAHVHAVISAVVKFMIVVGLLSFIRGWFIMRDVAEGNGQASLMAGITHLAGGALAVNIGPLLNAIQNTLGITDYGLNFGVGL